MLYVSGDGKEEAYISSADWMTRNLSRRVELLCPVYDPKLRQMIRNLLHITLHDNVKARKLRPNGGYERVSNSEPPLRSQFKAADIDSWKT
jgi:polyphosphate kinase